MGKNDSYVNCTISELILNLEKRLSPKRFLHTLGVAQIAAFLAALHGESREKALTAGLLHDIAKPFSDQELMDFCKREQLPVSEAEALAPYLLHGKVGAMLARDEFGVEDPEILKAIEFHTTGRPDMSLLEILVFIADYIEPARDRQPKLNRRRQQAVEDPEKALVKILKDTVEYLGQTGAPVDPMTQKTLEWYQAKAAKKNSKE